MDPFRKKARTGWSLTSDASECVCETCRVSDHPVCGSSVASRLLIDAAATPPLQGGEYASTKLCLLVNVIQLIGRNVIAHIINTIIGKPQFFRRRVPVEADGVPNSGRKNFKTRT